MSDRSKRRALVVGLATLAVPVLAAVPASGDSETAGAPNAATITAKFRNNDFVFRPSQESVASGGTINLRNQTPEEHTFSVVEARKIPESDRAQQRCFRKGHICRKLFNAHRGGDKPLVDRHRDGFDQPIDSIVFDDPASIDVSENADNRLNFFCAIHPNMQGRVNVR
jgi:plastocyanin